MSFFRYTARNKEKKKVAGVIEAMNEAEAKDKLRELKLTLLQLQQDNTRFSRKKITGDSLVIFTSQLSQLVSAQIPVYECLQALEEQSRSDSMHSVILGITERIQSGLTLSRAMQDFPECFSPLYRALIAAGEAVGNLELALSRLTQLLTREQKVKKQVLSALTYPIFLAVLLVVAVMILVTFVIPSLESLFEERELPVFTQIVLGLSDILRRWGLVIIAGCVGGVMFFIYRLKTRQFRDKLEKFLLRVPYISSFITRGALSRYGRTLATLLDGGLPLASAMQLSEEAIGCAPFEDLLSYVRERLMEGRSFSSELSRFQEVPPLFCRMIKIGEDSGRLAPLLLQIASIYEEESERVLHRFVTLVQPILLLLMGVCIGGVLLSILLPLSDFGSSIQL